MLARRGRQRRRRCRGQHSSLGGRTLAGPPQRAFLGCLKVMQFPSTLESTARPAPGPTFPRIPPHDEDHPDSGRLHAHGPSGEDRGRARGAQDVHNSLPRRHEREGVHRDHRFGGDQRASGLKPATVGRQWKCACALRAAVTRALVSARLGARAQGSPLCSALSISSRSRFARTPYLPSPAAPSYSLPQGRNKTLTAASPLRPCGRAGSRKKRHSALRP